VVLHGLDLLDDQLDLWPQYFFEELHRVAQPLEVNAQGVQRGDRRAVHQGLVGAHALVVFVDQARGDMPHLVGLDAITALDGQRARTRRGDEAVQPLDETGEARCVQRLNQRRACGIVVGLPGRKQRGEIGARISGDELPGLLAEYVKVAHFAERRRRPAQPAQQRPDRLRVEEGAEQPEGAAHPAGRHAHIVHSLDVRAEPRDRLVEQHPLEVEM